MQSRAQLAEAILQPLLDVAHERAARERDAALAARVAALKTYQQARFRRTYADLLAGPRYGAAARFFLDELYGNADFAQRDTQFQRIVPALTRMFPQDAAQTVLRLAQLHALTEQLDSGMGRLLPSASVDAAAYVAAWAALGAAEQRERQIALTLAVGRDLDTLTRKPLLLATLRMMRGPGPRRRPGATAAVPGKRLHHVQEHGWRGRLPGLRGRARAGLVCGLVRPGRGGRSAAAHRCARNNYPSGAGPRAEQWTGPSPAMELPVPC